MRNTFERSFRGETSRSTSTTSCSADISGSSCGLKTPFCGRSAPIRFPEASCSPFRGSFCWSVPSRLTHLQWVNWTSFLGLDLAIFTDFWHRLGCCWEDVLQKVEALVVDGSQVLVFEELVPENRRNDMQILIEEDQLLFLRQVVRELLVVVDQCQDVLEVDVEEGDVCCRTCFSLKLPFFLHLFFLFLFFSNLSKYSLFFFKISFWIVKPFSSFSLFSSLSCESETLFILKVNDAMGWLLLRNLSKSSLVSSSVK